MSLVAVWTDGYLAHDAEWLVWAGMRFDGDEEAVRAELLKAELDRAGVQMVPAEEHGRTPIEAVHLPDMVDYLETAYQGWVEAGYPAEHGSDRVVPYAFPHPDAFGAYPTRRPQSRAAMAGVYCMDTTTTIGPGTYRGARAAVDGALTAARTGPRRGTGGLCAGSATGAPCRHLLFRWLVLSEQRGGGGELARR